MLGMQEIDYTDPVAREARLKAIHGEDKVEQWKRQKTEYRGLPTMVGEPKDPAAEKAALVSYKAKVQRQLYPIETTDPTKKSRYWLYTTFQSPDDIKDIMDNYVSLDKLPPCMQYAVMQKEECPTTFNTHLHAFFWLKEPRNWKQMNFYLKRKAGTGHWRAHDGCTYGVKYCTKEETRIAGPWHYGVPK